MKAESIVSKVPFADSEKEDPSVMSDLRWRPADGQRPALLRDIALIRSRAALCSFAGVTNRLDTDHTHSLRAAVRI